MPGLPRAVDASLALLGLTVTAPILAVVAVAVRATSRGPALFRQERVGRGGARFTLLKFRSMHLNARGPEVTSRGDRRVTTVGRVLRKLKLDELPGLWNVVRGDMALVGPRPEVPKYVDPLDGRWRSVLAVRPGLTDPVTVKLRNEEELLESAGDDKEGFYLTVLQPYKLAGYVEYLTGRTWRSDIRVLFETARAVVVPQSAPPPSIEEIRTGGAAGVGREIS